MTDPIYPASAAWALAFTDVHRKLGRFASGNIAIRPGRDKSYHYAAADAPVGCAPESKNAETPFFVPYTSSLAGKRQASGDRLASSEGRSA